MLEAEIESKFPLTGFPKIAQKMLTSVPLSYYFPVDPPMGHIHFILEWTPGNASAPTSKTTICY